MIEKEKLEVKIRKRLLWQFGYLDGSTECRGQGCFWLLYYSVGFLLCCFAEMLSNLSMSLFKGGDPNCMHCSRSRSCQSSIKQM